MSAQESAPDAPGAVIAKPTGEELRSDVLSGLTHFELAKKYKVSHQTIAYWMNKAGFAVRRVPLRFGEYFILHRRDGTEVRIEREEE